LCKLLANKASPALDNARAVRILRQTACSKINTSLFTGQSQRKLIVFSKSFLQGFLCCFIMMMGFFSLDAKAIMDPSFYNSLFRSRQALLDQRQHLLESASNLGAQIDALNRQLDTVNQYLRDTDRAIKDVEETMARVK
jgi:hypothetical protein